MIHWAWLILAFFSGLVLIPGFVYLGLVIMMWVKGEYIQW